MVGGNNFCSPLPPFLCVQGIGEPPDAAADVRFNACICCCCEAGSCVKSPAHNLSIFRGGGNCGGRVDDVDDDDDDATAACRW
jgi:hypothetical protein